MFKPDLNIKLFFRIYDAKSGDHLIPGGGGGGGVSVFKKEIVQQICSAACGKIGCS